MINTKVLKNSKRIAIILLIAAFSIVGIISCAGDEITGSGGISYSGENVGGNMSGGGLNTSFPYWPKNYTISPNDTGILPDDNPSDYYDIRVPFGVEGDGYTNVSYKDVSKLKQLWFEQINRKAANDGKVFAIRNAKNNRDANNFQSRHTDGQYSAQDYYYFNESGDIVWKEDNTIIKKFMGAVIIPYRDITIKRGDKPRYADNSQAIQKNGITWKEKSIFTIGGVYANTFTTERARERYAGDNPFKDGVFDFVTARHLVQTFWSGETFVNNQFERQYINPGFIEVFVMYDYDNQGYSGAASVHSYYAYYGIYNYYEEYNNHPGIYFTPKNMPYMTNENMYLAQRPEFISKQLNHTAMFTDKHRGWQFLFMPGQMD